MSEYPPPPPGNFKLFKNKSKQEGDKKPDYEGSGTGLNGQPLRIVAWVNRPQGKQVYLSVKISVPQAEQPPAARPVSHFTPDDDAPF